MLRFTPCDHPGDAVNYSSIDSCVAGCQSSCIKAGDCTTAVTKDMCGNGRVCEDGALGVDSQGACKPEFGELRDACDKFDANCTSCSDSDACQAMCSAVSQHSLYVPNPEKDHPDVCPSFDCPDCVGPCFKCSSSSCVSWCNSYHNPRVYCMGDKATSVQGTFSEYSLQNRNTESEKAMGVFYDAKCRQDNINKSGAYLNAFGPRSARSRANLRNRYEQQSTADYLEDRARIREERRERQLKALGISGTLRSRRRRSNRSQQNHQQLASCTNSLGQVMHADDTGGCSVLSVEGNTTAPSIKNLMKTLFRAKKDGSCKKTSRGTVICPIKSSRY